MLRLEGCLDNALRNTSELYLGSGLIPLKMISEVAFRLLENIFKALCYGTAFRDES